MEASEFDYWRPGPEPAPTLGERLDALIFPSDPMRIAINQLVFATVGMLALLLVLKL